MSYFNQVILIGNLGKDPDVLKSTEQGDFVRISLATSRRFRDKNGELQTDTQWHVIYLSNRIGKIASSYLKKGDKIFLIGELRTREWFDDKGVRHFHTSVYAKELKFVNVKPQDDLQHELVQKQDAYSTAMQEIRTALDGHPVNN